MGFWSRPANEQTTDHGQGRHGDRTQLLPRKIVSRDFGGRRPLHTTRTEDRESNRQVIIILYNTFFVFPNFLPFCFIRQHVV